MRVSAAEFKKTFGHEPPEQTFPKFDPKNPPPEFLPTYRPTQKPTIDNMTGAELQTLREACNLSREDLGELAGVQARTVKHWENGRAGVPADVADLMHRMDAAVWHAAHELLQQTIATDATTGRLPAERVLLRYQPADVLRYQIYITGWVSGGMNSEQAAAIQGALIGRVRMMARWSTSDELHSVRVVWMRSDIYEAWRAVHKLADSEATRSQWAAGQVAAQAKPHRADQPPAA